MTRHTLWPRDWLFVVNRFNGAIVAFGEPTVVVQSDCVYIEAVQVLFIYMVCVCGLSHLHMYTSIKSQSSFYKDG